MEEGDSVKTYLARVLSIAKKMKGCGDDVKEKTIIKKITRSLSKSFNYVVCSIEESTICTLETMTLDKLQSSLSLHEQQMINTTKEEQVLRVSDHQKGAGGRGRGSYRGNLFVRLGNRTKMQVKGTGTIKLCVGGGHLQ